MSPEHKTSSDNSQAEGVSPWSEKAQNDRLEANHPTVEDPVLFDFDHATEMVGFSQVPGENLRGIKIGYFYDKEGNRVNIIELTAKSRDISGWDKDVMMVPESAINKPDDNAERFTSVSVKEDLGDTVLSSVDVQRPIEDSNQSGVNESLQRFTQDEMRELRRKAREATESDDTHSSDTGFMPTVESENNKSIYRDLLQDPNYKAPGVEAAAVRPKESEDDRLTRERRKTDLDALANDAYLMAKSMKQQ
ncbi:MAG TPA: hypothetical protein PLZ58_03400 [Candidatus Saccharibacteria bacterium]|nr:hypothetical protein [Candidatus Saccharibacteria bacterium]HRQ06881.1 hypothetical protein [Candidatus Saccharibacteria bacterium]